MRRARGTTGDAIAPATARMVVAALLVAAALSSGCNTPDKANIALRKENQSLTETIAGLERRHQADQATIAGMTATRGGDATTALDSSRLDDLFTTHGMRFGRLSGGWDRDPDAPGDEGLTLHVIPIDGEGDDFKAAASFVVEAFDLAAADPVVGRWEFPLAESRKLWFGRALLYEYVLNCPWQNIVPAHDELTVKVTLTDGLTGRVFTQQRVMTIASGRRNPTTRP